MFRSRIKSFVVMPARRTGLLRVLIIWCLVCSKGLSGRRLKNYAEFLSHYGHPHTASTPAALCDRSGVTVAIPVSKEWWNPNSLSWGSLISTRQIQLNFGNDRQAECAARLEKNFFGNSSAALARDAWLGRATHEGCEGHSVKLEDSVVIHSNRFSIALREGDRKVVLSTCVCSRGVCNASARFESEVLEQTNAGWIGGYTANTVALLGLSRGVNILPDYSRWVPEIVCLFT